VRNMASELATRRGITKPPRMSRDKALEWMANVAGVTVTEVILMWPIVFAERYVVNSRAEATLLVHGTSWRWAFKPDYYDAASEWTMQRAWDEVHAPAPSVPAPSVTVPPVTVPSITVPVVDEPAVAETCFPVVERMGYDDDDDDYDSRPTVQEAAEALVSMLDKMKQADREQAEREKVDREDYDTPDFDEVKAKQQEEFRTRLFLSEHLIAAELKMGLLDADTEAGATPGSFSSISLMARMIAIMGKLCDMEQ